MLLYKDADNNKEGGINDAQSNYSTISVPSNSALQPQKGVSNYTSKA